MISIFYNLEASLLRTVGDSITPLIILAISCLLNIFFDYAAIVHMKLGAARAAWATVLAQAISALLCLIWIILKKRELWPEASEYRWDKTLARELAFQGLSMGFMSSIVSIGSVILQFGINQLGAGYLGVCFSEPVCWSLMALYLALAYRRLALFKAHQIKAQIL